MVVAMATLSNDIRTLKLGFIRGRHVTRFIGMTLLADLIISAVLGITIVVAKNDSDKTAALTRQNAANAITSCKTSNVTRADEVKLWSHLIASLPAATSVDKAFEEEFLTFVQTTFAPRSCG